MSALLSLANSAKRSRSSNRSGKGKFLPASPRRFEPDGRVTRQAPSSIVVYEREAWDLYSLGNLFGSGLCAARGARVRDRRDWRGAERRQPLRGVVLQHNAHPNSPTPSFTAMPTVHEFNYYDFAHVFNADTRLWNPSAWADLFKETGARYVVLTTKHHDGFTLWPSAVMNPHLRPDQSHSPRDLVGDLARAVRQDGLKMGVYYSGLYDWSFGSGPFLAEDNVAVALRQQGSAYPGYADAQLHELIAKYKPDILWNDIGYSPEGKALEIAAHFYNSNPDGVINDRWKPFLFHDFTTPEYAKPDFISTEKWEECRGPREVFRSQSDGGSRMRPFRRGAGGAAGRHRGEERQFAARRGAGAGRDDSAYPSRSTSRARCLAQAERRGHL